MTIVASKHGWPYLKKYLDNRFSTNKAIDVLKRRRGELNIGKEGLSILEKSINFYDGLSHPTRLALADIMSLDGTHKVYIGASFDNAKIKGYKKEIDGRVGFARTINNIISGVEKNMRAWNLKG